MNLRKSPNAKWSNKLTRIWLFLNINWCIEMTLLHFNKRFLSSIGNDSYTRTNFVGWLWNWWKWRCCFLNILRNIQKHQICKHLCKPIYEISIKKLMPNKQISTSFLLIKNLKSYCVLFIIDDTITLILWWINKWCLRYFRTKLDHFSRLNKKVVESKFRMVSKRV